MNPRHRRGLLLAGVLLAACTTAPTAPPSGLFDATRVTAPACGATATVSPPTRLAVSVLRAPEISDDALRDTTAVAAAVFAPAGVILEATTLRAHDGGPALAGTEAEVRRALDLAGVHDGPEAEAIILAAVVAPLGDIVRSDAGQGFDLVLVVLPRVATPDSMANRVLAEIDGIGVGPAIADIPGGADLLAALGAPDRFTPVAVVGSGDGFTAGFAAAHEIGHALGLPHRDLPGNLMATDRPSCVPGLTADQAAVMAAAGER